MAKRASSRSFVLYVFGIALILFGIIANLICMFNTSHDHVQYQNKISEIYTHEEIYDVMLYNDSVYVCYCNGTCVNVYSIDGAFRWAVSTPSLNRGRFVIDDGNLLIFDYDVEEECYIYNAETGAFVRLGSYSISEESDYSIPFNVPLDDLSSGDICYDNYQVYFVDEQGDLNVLVERPDWYRLTSPSLLISLALMGVLLILISWSLQSFHALRFLGTSKHEKSSPALIRWSKTAVMVQIGYALLIHFCELLDWLEFLYILVIPLILHTVIYSVVLSKSERASDEIDQDASSPKTAMSYWSALQFSTFLIALISMFISAIL